MPTMRPPMMAPGIESRPPRITTGKTLKPTRARFTSTPSMLPHRTPPSAETMPVMAQASPKYRSTSMPTAMATCWLSATARMAMPLRDFRKNHPKPARNTRLTAAPRSWIGGMKSGPSAIGSSRMGSGKVRVPAPIVAGPMPRRIEARPIVAMTTAMIGRPINLRSMTRSRAKPNATMPISPRVTASHSGAPHAPRLPATMRPANITNSPWAKLTASVALYTSTKPSAMSAYIRPMSTPLLSSSRKNPNSSGMGWHALHVLDPHPRLHGGLTAVFERDRGGELDLRSPRIERADHRLVLFRDEPTADLPRPRHLGVIRLEIFGEQEEPPDLGGRGEGLVDLLDLAADQRADLRLLGEVRVARVGKPAPLGPVAHRVEVDRDHGRHERPLVPEGHGLADVGAELELVLDELGCERRPVAESAHVLGAVDDHEVAPRIEKAGVAGVKPAVVVDDFARCLRILQIALEDHRPADQHLAALGDLDVDTRAGTAGGRRVRLGARLERHEPRRLRRSVDLLQVDADRSEEAERIGAEGSPTGERPAGAAQAELIPDRPVDEELPGGVRESQPRGNRFAFRPEDLRALGHAAEVVEDAPLESRRVRRPHLHRGQHVLPDARRCQHRRRPELAQVPLDRLRALGTVGAKARGQAHEQRVHGVARPRHRQVGEPVVVGPELLRLVEGLRDPNRALVSEHGALRIARRARRVADDRHVLGPALLDLRGEVVRMGLRELAA